MDTPRKGEVHMGKLNSYTLGFTETGQLDYRSMQYTKEGEKSQIKSVHLISAVD